MIRPTKKQIIAAAEMVSNTAVGSNRFSCNALTIAMNERYHQQYMTSKEYSQFYDKDFMRISDFINYTDLTPSRKAVQLHRSLALLLCAEARADILPKGGTK